MNREEYWKTKIVIVCPFGYKSHTINDCFEKCEMWGRNYLKDKDGRVAAFLYCHAKTGEPYLHDGKPTRDN